MNNFLMAMSWKISILDSCSSYFNDQTTMKKISGTIKVRKKSWDMIGAFRNAIFIKLFELGFQEKITSVTCLLDCTKNKVFH